MNKLKWIVENPGKTITKIFNHFLLLLPDELYLKVKFRQIMGKKLDLMNPQTFSEKLQWLKLYNRRPEYTIMVDKYAVKSYVARIIGDKYIIPTLGVWDKPDDIDWNSLPNQFVLKCTHDSGGLVICRDKTKLDKDSVIIRLRKTLKQNYYRKWREWPYKDVPRRIIAEEYLDPSPEFRDLRDYKFFCFNGEPKYCQVISDRNTNMCCDFFDKEWKHQIFHEPRIYPFSKLRLEKPSKYEEMWKLAGELAKDKAFSRIDFYEVNGNVFFGEITFFPTTGMGGFDPDEYDLKFGELIKLPPKYPTIVSSK